MRRRERVSPAACGECCDKWGWLSSVVNAELMCSPIWCGKPGFPGLRPSSEEAEWVVLVGSQRTKLKGVGC